MATGCGNSMAGDGDESMQLMRSPGLHLAPGEAPIDLLAATRAVTDLLTALGQNPQSAHLVDTPRRVADAFAAMLTPAPFTLTTFPTRSVTTSWSWPATSPSLRCASTTCCRSPG